MRHTAPLLALWLGLAALPLRADVIDMPMPYDAPAAPYQGVSPEELLKRPRVELSLPVRGMSMEQVEAKYGRALEVVPAVGRPPITRWVYDDFTVYFEYLYVIRSVEKQRPMQRPELPPLPATLPEAAPALSTEGESVAPGLYE